MKKALHIFILLLALLFIHGTAKAQAHEKGNFNIDVGIGFAGYSSEVKVTVDFLGQPITLTETDGSASTIVPIGFEYGVSNLFGIGIQLGFQNYFIDKEDTTDLTKSARSTDFDVMFNFHVLNGNRNDFYLGLVLGGSSAVLNLKDGSELSGSGSHVSFYLADRFFFTDNIGIKFHLGFPMYKYTNLKVSGINSIDLSNWDWSLRGVHFGTGLAIKF